MKQFYPCRVKDLPQFTISYLRNTLLVVAGVSTRGREEYGEFFGIDVGKEELIDKSHFAN